MTISLLPLGIPSL